MSRVSDFQTWQRDSWLGGLNCVCQTKHSFVDVKGLYFRNPCNEIIPLILLGVRILGGRSRIRDRGRRKLHWRQRPERAFHVRLLSRRGAVEPHWQGRTGGNRI